MEFLLTCVSTEKAYSSNILSGENFAGKMESQRTQQVEKTAEFAKGAASDKVIAKPSDVCCLKGSIHEGEPRGTRATVAGVDTYVVEPPKGKSNGNILLYFPDVWGFFNNGFLIMDGFAHAGYLTLGLDYFRDV